MKNKIKEEFRRGDLLRGSLSSGQTHNLYIFLGPWNEIRGTRGHEGQLYNVKTKQKFWDNLRFYIRFQ